MVVLNKGYKLDFYKKALITDRGYRLSIKL